MTGKAQRGGSGKAEAAPDSLKARLRGRQRATITYPVLVDDPDAALAELEAAVAAARQVRIKYEPDSPEWAQAQQLVDQAQDKVAACHAEIVLTGLPPDDYEDLIAEHPPTDEQMERWRQQVAEAKRNGLTPPDAPVWDQSTFQPALLADTAAGDMTADDWAAFLVENVAKGERQGLWVAALAVNESARPAERVQLPKGWTRTVSSRSS